MKEKIFNIIIITISLYVLGVLLLEKELIYSSVIYSLNIWVKSLVPALFPFFIISDILINYQIIYYIPHSIRSLFKKLFNISDNMLAIFILSMVSGFPSNARNTRTLYDQKLISIEEANHILIFSHFANPVFILTTIAVFFLKDDKVGIVLLVSHYLSNFVLGICFRKKDNLVNNSSFDSKEKVFFGNVFITSIKKAIDTILMICGILVVFLTLATIIGHTFNFNNYNLMIVKGIMEITIGIEALGKLKVAMIYKAVIASMILAFGGLSVHVQVISQIIGTKIKYHYFFMGRMYQMIISGILTYIICLIWGI